jgi:glycosyltransferase involved in cell wall biosynthesis
MNLAEKPPTVAVVYGSVAGVGGLGLQSANAIADLAELAEPVLAIGPGRAPGALSSPRVTWLDLPRGVSPFAARYSWLRWCTGRLQYLADTRLGRMAADVVARAGPDICYCFTQVGLETLRWANRAKVPAILESPNGHIRNFREVYRREARRFGASWYLGHPSAALVERVEEEYSRADLIRVSSEWARESLAHAGVARDKLVLVPQRPVAQDFLPLASRPTPAGRLRVCFVGTLDLRKGFIYLLRAARRFGPERIVLQLVGGTVDRQTRRLLARERSGLDVEAAPGQPLPALHWAELFVLPTLEDGSAFVVVEAMAAGVPVITTDQCGNASLIRPGETGWVVRAADEDALLAALNEAYARRADLRRMGAAARADWERLMRESNLPALRALLEQALHCRSAVGAPC